MSTAVRIRSEPLRFLAFDEIFGGFVPIGPAFQHPIRMFYMLNLTDQPLIVSDNGVDEKWVIASNSFLLLDISSNQTGDRGFYYAQGDRFWVITAAGAPTTGSLYLTTWYGDAGYNAGGQG